MLGLPKTIKDYYQMIAAMHPSFLSAHSVKSPEILSVDSIVLTDDSDTSDTSKPDLKLGLEDWTSSIGAQYAIDLDILAKDLTEQDYTEMIEHYEDLAIDMLADTEYDIACQEAAFIRDADRMDAWHSTH